MVIVLRNLPFLFKFHKILQKVFPDGTVFTPFLDQISKHTIEELRNLLRHEAIETLIGKRNSDNQQYHLKPKKLVKAGKNVIRVKMIPVDAPGSNIILPSFGRIGSGELNELPSIPIPHEATTSEVYKDIALFT